VKLANFRGMNVEFFSETAEQINTGNLLPQNSLQCELLAIAMNKDCSPQSGRQRLIVFGCRPLRGLNFISLT
jgi:hypothetical protein